MSTSIDNVVGQPDLRFIPPHLKFGRLPAYMEELIEYGYENDRQGMPECLKAVAKYYNRHNRLVDEEAIRPGQIIMAAGARSAASIILLYLINHAEEHGIAKSRALLLKPGYSLYLPQFRSMGYGVDEVNVPVSYSDDEKIEAIRASITPDTVLLPLTNPNNPTGEIYSENFLRKLLGLLDEFPQLNIINDAVYDHIVRVGLEPPVSIFAIADEKHKPRVFEVNSLAKSYAYPAIRAGWAIGEENIMRAIQETKDPVLGSLPNVSQLVTIAALNATRSQYPTYHRDVNTIYDRRMNLVHSKLGLIEGYKGEVPKGTFYYWADFSGAQVNVTDMIHELAKKKIMLSHGAKFGDPNCIRFNCGASGGELEIICENILEYCRNKGIAVKAGEPIRTAAKHDKLDFSSITIGSVPGSR